MKVIKNIKSIITLLISICILILLLIFINHFSSDLFQNMFKKVPWVQNEIKTNTSVTSVESKSELVTARMSLDFINQLEGVDGRYIEILTYEITAGIDSKDHLIKVLHSDQKDALVLRDKISADAFDSYTKPVKLAYEQKAKDYAVENGILQTAKEKGEKLLKNLADSEHAYELEKFLTSVKLPQLPMEMNIASKIPLVIDTELSTNQERFLRDSIVLRPENQNKNWSIAIGDTGMTYSGNYKSFYKNLIETNCKKDNEGKDFPEVFRYFNPHKPNETEVVSFASDSYRTFFILKGSRIYYLNAEYTSEQELTDEIAPVMVYLAASMQNRINDKDDLENQYTKYIQNYAKVSQNLRQNDDVYTLENNVLKLINANVANGDRPLTTGDRPLTQLSPDEKLFYKLYNLKQNKLADKTEDNFIDNSSDFYMSLINPDSLFIPENRKQTENTLNKLNEEQIKIYKNYLYSYYLQNSLQLNLSQEENQLCKDYISKASAVLFNRDAIIDMNYEERNEYFKNVFQNHLKNSKRIADTAEKSTDLLPVADFENNKFLYFDVDKNQYNPEEILREINRQNNNRNITECFILVFRQTEWNWGNLFSDTDIHALVLDDATLRIFPNVACNNFPESTKKKINAMFRSKNAVPYYFYGDWEKLQISPYDVKLNGQSFTTRRITKSSKADYRASNEYSELSTMAQVLSNLQHAYYIESSNYYLESIKNSILEELSYYAYEKSFRPSPRLTLDKTEDKMKRYNY